MMNYEKKEQKIWQLIDGNLSDAERDTLLTEIELDSELTLIYNRCSSINTELLNQGLDVPSFNFTDNLMEHIAQINIKAIQFSYKKFFTILLSAMIAALLLNLYVPLFSSSSEYFKLDPGVLESLFGGLGSKYTLYGVVSIPLLILFWADIYFSKLRTNQ